MKTTLLFLIPVLIPTAILWTGCSAKTDSETSSPALPPSWYQTSQPADNSSQDFEKPSPSFENSVLTTFQEHADLLSQISGGSGPIYSQILSSHPSDWTPWHLDGMMADFAIDVNGLFGVLIGTGTASVKVTWQQPSSSVSSATLNSKKTNSQTLHFSNTITKKNIEQSLEPTVRAAVASGHIQNEKVFRQNLQRKAADFVSVGEALDLVPRVPGWHVDTYQLQLTFNGQGQLMPTFGVGGSVNIYFDWQPDPEKKFLNSDPSVQLLIQSPLYRGLKTMVEVLGPVVSEARAQTLDIRKSGFDLDLIQLGVALTVGGDIGIATLEGTETGKIYFKVDPVNTLNPNLRGYYQRPWLDDSEEIIPFVRSDSSDYLSFNLNVPSTKRRANGNLVKMSRSRFRKGFTKALHMADYFAHTARKAQRSKWNVTQIETEFDASVGGDFKIVNVEGTGQLVLDFDRMSGQE